MRHNFAPATATLPTALIIMALLAGCQVKDDQQQQAPVATAETQAIAQEPTQVVVEQQAPVAAQPVLATQPGPSGSNVELNKVAVTGNVLTVQVTVKPGVDDGLSLYMKGDEISLIDDATAQRYSLLKDSTGKIMASPLSSDTQVGNYTARGESRVYWFKFPAPPATSPTVSINLPNVAPFDGVAVTR